MKRVPDDPSMSLHRVSTGHRVAAWLLPLLVCLSGATVAGSPNFVILLVDDAAYMDLGGYGGEARTPHINSLADRGVRFSHYRTSPMCAPSRAMLLTGLDSHKTGVGTLPELISQEQQGSDAYALHLLPGVETVADHLGKVGYEAFMTGKWHLGERVENLPHRHGFDRSFALAASGADNWEDKAFIPFYPDAPWYEDGEAVSLPEDFYSSEFLVDQMITYLQERDRSRPFFSYVAFQAIHIPVQAPRAFTRNYEGVYSDGWDALATRRFERAQALGLINPDAAPPVPHPALRRWELLAASEQKHYETSMMVNAGMLEAMDHHIGRLLTYLRDSGDLDNTVFFVTSDNGPEPADITQDAIFRLWMARNGYHIDPDSLGERGYMGAIGAEWASAAAVPGSLHKMHAADGGTRVPLIVSGPGITSQSFNPARAFVTDITPTILEMAGAPAENRAPMDGRSLLPVLENRVAQVYGPNDPIATELGGNAFLVLGDYKITRNTLPRGDGRWRLHHVATDPAERIDLSQDLPQLRAAMLAQYENYALRNGVIALPKDFDVMLQANRNGQYRLIMRNLGTIILALGCLALAIVLMVRLWKRTREKNERLT